MGDTWVCLDCGARQPAAGKCGACGADEMHDMSSENVRELMRDIDQRLRDRRETLSRWLGVVIGVGVIFALWLVPGYWSLRGAVYPGLPFLFDQWIFMALLGFGVMKLLERALARPRFPYLQA